MDAAPTAIIEKQADAIQQTEKYSIREFYPNTWGGIVGDGVGIWYPGQSEIIQAWGTYACDFMLRAFHYMPHNGLWQGASDLYIQKVLSTPYEISGGRNLTFKWQDIFFEADFGEGYDFMLSKALTDYLTLNRGMFLELVSYGDPDTPLKEGARILGINHLDALRVVFTGNREYPYIYYSEETSKAHRLHYTRVKHIAHAPSPNTRMFGMGKSPLYNVLSTVNSQILLGRHQTELLSDLPPPGLIVFGNVKGEDVGSAMRQFEMERRRDGQSVYRAPMRLEGKDPTQPVTVTFVPLSQVPEGFDYEKYMQTHVNLMALGMQLDPQDIWPLTGQPMGTGTQSKILASKTLVKGPGYLLTRLERMWNTVTPRPLEWKYKAQNAEQDLETATIAEKWTAIIRDATYLTDEEKRQMAANQIPAFADVLMDEQGNVRLPDDDPKAQGQEVVATDTEELDTPTEAPPGQPPPADVTATDDQQLVNKEYEATKSAFESDLAAIFADANAGSISKTSFKARMRSTINTYGKAAYLDGLEAGGVEVDSLDGEDSDTFAGLLASQSMYVSNVADEIYATETGLKGTPDFKAGMWGNKTLTPFYQAGLMSADMNGLYKWVYGDTEHCDDCRRLNGQKHRLKDWKKKGWMPQASQLKCKGYNCKCGLEKTTGKASGGY